MYSTEVSLYFHIIPGTLMHFPHLGTCLKILAVEIGLLHSEPFTHSHFFFLTILKSATSEGLCQCPNLHSSVFCLCSEMVYHVSSLFMEQISALSEFLKSFQGRTCTLLCLVIMLKNYDIFM
jgi:hypothetical protein